MINTTLFHLFYECNLHDEEMLQNSHNHIYNACIMASSVLLE